MDNKCENFEIKKIHRSEVKNAPYNPRKIKPSAKKKLENNLKSIGLLSPIVWNKRTGNIVSGHRRLEASDRINKTKDYIVTVSAVDLDEKTEKEQNVFMNNKDAQGFFDFDMLKEMHKEIDIKAAGFETADILKFSDDITQEEESVLSELADKLRELENTRTNRREGNKKREDTGFYQVFVFETSQQRANAMMRLGFKVDQYQDGRLLDDLMRI